MPSRPLALVLVLFCACPAPPGSSGTDTSSSTATGDVDTTSTTGGPTTTTTSPTTSASVTTEGPDSTGDSACGNGSVDVDEVCDDGNAVTELGVGAAWPLGHAASACMADCRLVLATCGDGTVDPGEVCDDGNADSSDGCTTSCTVNDLGYHTPCRRTCEPLACDPGDVHEGTITGCDAVSAPPGGEKVCLETGKDSLVDQHFAEGECVTMAQTCAGTCLKYLTFGDYLDFGPCPDGTALVQRTTQKQGVMLQIRACHKTCDSDADCRWNAIDAVAGEPGQYRCQTTPNSDGAKICADARN